MSATTLTNNHIHEPPNRLAEYLAAPHPENIPSSVKTFEGPDLNELHKKEIPDATLPPKNLWEQIKKPNIYNALIGGINAALHAVASVTSFLPQVGPIKLINKFTNDTAFFCTRYIAPFFSFTLAAGSAAWNKKPIEALIKILPPIFLPLVGDANIDTVYGSSSGFNQPYDLAMERIKTRSEKDPSFKKLVDDANQSPGGNIKLVLSIFKEMFGDLIQGKMPKNELWYFINCALILGGALPMILFDRNGRDSTAAKILGLVRNAGGIMGDIGFAIFDRGNKHKLLVAVLCGISAIASIAKRWVNEKTSKVFIHLSAALDVAAYAAWNAFNANNHEKKDLSSKAALASA